MIDSEHSDVVMSYGKSIGDGGSRPCPNIFKDTQQDDETVPEISLCYVFNFIVLFVYICKFRLIIKMEKPPKYQNIQLFNNQIWKMLTFNFRLFLFVKKHKTT